MDLSSENVSQNENDSLPHCRIGCEVSLGLMRRQKEVLMCALRPFYFDPLVDWVSSREYRYLYQ